MAMGNYYFTGPDNVETKVDGFSGARPYTFEAFTGPDYVLDDD